MKWKKNFGKYLLIFACVIFWVSAAISFFDSQWNNPPDYFYNYSGDMTDVERKTEFLRVNKRLFWKILGNTLGLVIPFILLIHINWSYLVKRFLTEQRYCAYFWRLVILLFLVGLAWSFHPEMDQSTTALRSGGEVFFKIPETLVLMALAFWITVLTTPIYLSYNWFIQNAQLADLKNQKLETELSFLKSQINPHFFFNTLNNLYALTLENSSSAPAVILKLSDLMRYTIYDGRAATVFLKQEVAFIENYLELQKIRLHKKSEITFHKNIGNPDLKLPPLLFVIFLENAFKHGVETLRNNAIIDLQLSEKEGLIKFYALNNYDPEERNQSAGLGLENVKRRLQLLFGTAYKLEIVDQENSYRIYLTINISK